MELLFVILGGAILGALARYLLPHRAEHGSVLVPAVGAVVAAIVWVALTWLGWAWDGGWIWVVSLVAAGIVAVAADVLLGRSRIRSDAELLRTLMNTGTAKAI